MYFGCCYTTAILQWSITINLILKRAGFIYPRRNNSRRTPARTLSISGLESRNWQFWLKIMMKSGLDFPFWNLTSPNWFGRRSKELFLKKNERFFKILMTKSLAISVSFLWFINPKRDWISKKQNQVSSKSTNHVEYETGLDLIDNFQMEWSISYHCDMPWDALNCHWTAKLLQPSPASNILGGFRIAIYLLCSSF